jgi:hypothetical protein
MDLTSAGLRRTAESMDEERRTAFRERWSRSGDRMASTDD